MSKSSQRRAIDNYRSRLAERGMARFEVIGRETDRELIRAVARRLAEGGPEANRLRSAVSATMSGEPPSKGGIVKALLASPLVGSDLDLTRPREEGRRIDI
jgi:transposase InsO family protein